jgi:hypothetical protein
MYRINKYQSQFQMEANNFKIIRALDRDNKFYKTTKEQLVAIIFIIQH